MAEHANFEKHHQNEVDVRLLTPLKRPSTDLFTLPSINTVFEDLDRFQDVFSAMITPNNSDDVKKLLTECTYILGPGKEDLKNYVTEIESTLGVIEHSKDLLLKFKSFSCQDLGIKTNKLIHKLGIYQKEEGVIRSDQLLSYLTTINDSIEKSLGQSVCSLDSVDTKTCSDEVISEISGIRGTILSVTQRLASLKHKTSELKSLYHKRVADFTPLGWTEEKMRTLLPNISDTVQNDFKCLELMYEEKAILLTKLSDLKVFIVRVLEDFELFGTKKGTSY